jgi:hypothetical protein
LARKQQLDRTVRVPCTAELARIMDEQARQEGHTMSAWVRGLIVAALEAKGIAAPPLPADYATPAKSRMIHRTEDRVAA